MKTLKYRVVWLRRGRYMTATRNAWLLVIVHDVGDVDKGATFADSKGKIIPPLEILESSKFELPTFQQWH